MKTQKHHTKPSTRAFYNSETQLGRMEFLRTSLSAFKRVPYQLLPSHYHAPDSLSPKTILTQIVILQVFYYVTATILSYFLALLVGLTFSFEWIFSWHLVSLENSLGWTMIGLWLLDSIICVLFMTIIVGRSKLAWDFALTIHAIDLLTVWFYTGAFPTNFYWWCVQLASAVILVSLGTYTTRWRELRDTFFEGIVDTEVGGVGRSGIEMNDVSEV